MRKKKKKSMASLGITATMVAMMLIVGSSNVFAVPCGDTNLDGIHDTNCNCGDTVVGQAGYIYNLPGPLDCSQATGTFTRHGLIIGSPGIGIDGQGFMIDGGGVAGR
ncbi:MAG: hypothetical protein U9O82_06635, partial [Thermodesulfobacteriota bacterium]|nr:hypothetical protein [Thermodesulfobacteriota bacterium]